MIELSNERIEQILHEETANKEELETILRSIYTRYMRLYEKYFEDIDALNDDKIAELRNYHEETQSLVRYFYMDIFLDISMRLEEFEDMYAAKLLGPGWHEYLFGVYEEFREENGEKDKSEEQIKAEFSKQVLKSFYDVMNDIFRDAFGTGSKAVKDTINVVTGILFGRVGKRSK